MKGQIYCVETPMSSFNETEALEYLRVRGKNHVVGVNMTPTEALQFFRRQGKTVLTFFGYSVDYQDEKGMLAIARGVLSSYSPASTLVNIGATQGGLGAVYPLAKSLGFTTTGIVSRKALEIADEMSDSVDDICFIADDEWGGKKADGTLFPTSEAMVKCSDILIGIGGGPISRDEMLAGKAMGKPVTFYPAEISHRSAIEQAKKKGLPTPTSFWGEAHEVFAPSTFKG